MRSSIARGTLATACTSSIAAPCCFGRSGPAGRSSGCGSSEPARSSARRRCSTARRASSPCARWARRPSCASPWSPCARCWPSSRSWRRCCVRWRSATAAPRCGPRWRLRAAASHASGWAATWTSPSPVASGCGFAWRTCLRAAPASPGFPSWLREAGRLSFSLGVDGDSEILRASAEVRWRHLDSIGVAFEAPGPALRRSVEQALRALLATAA